MTILLGLLRARDTIVTPEGTPTMPFQNDWQKLSEAVESKADRTGITLTNATNDAGAAAAGVPVGSYYRNGSVVMLRVA